MSLDLKFGPEVEQILLRTGIQLRKANKATAFFLPVCQGSRARLRCALCSAGCTEDRSLQIRWEHSTEEFNQQLQDLTHGVPGIRDHSGIQPSKKKMTMVISLPKLRRGGLPSLNLKREMHRAE